MLIKGFDKNRFLFGLPVMVTIVGILIIASLLFWKLKYNFYFWDEIDWLNAIVSNSFSFFSPHNEHFIPLMKMYYWLEVNVFHLRPALMQDLIIVFHTLTGFSIGYLIWKFTKNNFVALISIIIFIFHPFNYENLTWLLQASVIINVFFNLIAIIFITLYSEHKKRSYYFGAIIFAVLQSYWFGTGLIFPFLIGVYFLLKMDLISFKDKIIKSLPFFLIFIVNIVIYKILTPLVINKEPLTAVTLMTNLTSFLDYFTNGLIVNITRVFTLVERPTLVTSIFVFVLLIAFILIMFNRLINKERLLLAFFTFSFIITLLFIGISRYVYGNEQAYASRYVYYYLPQIIIIMGILLGSMIKELNKNKLKVYIINSFLMGLTIVFLVISYIYTSDYKTNVSNRNETNIRNVYTVLNEPNKNIDSSQLHPTITKEDLAKIFSEIQK